MLVDDDVIIVFKGGEGTTRSIECLREGKDGGIW